MDTNKLINLMKKCLIFSSLDEEEISQLIKKSKKFQLPTGNALFRQGEVSSCLYILISGKIKVYVLKKNHENRYIGDVKTGETLGEQSALSKEPRALSAFASEDSVLLELSSDDFQSLCEKHPLVALNTIRSFVDHSRNLIQMVSETGIKRKHIAVISIDKSLPLKSFSKQISKYTASSPHTHLLSEHEPSFQKKYKTKRSIRNLIEKLEKEKESIIYILDSHESLLANVVLEKIDTFYLATRQKPKIDINPEILSLIHPKQVLPELILIKKNGAQSDAFIESWQKTVPFSLHHFVRSNHDDDHKRMARFMSGRPIGLVLGGGGLRSWAHLGAIKAIKKANIPIDIIGGTSAGAIVAAHYSLYGTERQNNLKTLSKTAHNIVSIKNLTWPLLSFFNTKSYAEKQKEIFDDIKIENLPIPAFFVSCNLSQNTEVVHRGGKLWKAIASSTAVPGIFPPIPIEGELEVDGGIINNLPVDVMRKLIGPHGRVIAVELTHYDQDDEKYHYPLSLGFWETIFTKLGLSNRKCKFPSFLDTFLKSLLAGSVYNQKRNALNADILIKPDLSQFSLLKVSQKQEKLLTKIGEKETTLVLEKEKRKLL